MPGGKETGSGFGDFADKATPGPVDGAMPQNTPIVPPAVPQKKDNTQDQPGTKEGYGRMPLGKTKQDCEGESQKTGGVAWDEHAQACWQVFGKAVKIGRAENSIQEGFEVVNFNFRTNGTMPAVPSQENLPQNNDTSNLDKGTNGMNGLHGQTT
jgi:hypothetical protein